MSYSSPINSQGKALSIVAALPQSINRGKDLYKKLLLKQKHASTATLDIAYGLTDEILATKSYAIDTLWGRMEKRFNQGETLMPKGKDQWQELETALTLFYPAAQDLFEQQQMGGFQELTNLYLSVKKFVKNRLIPLEEGMEKRNLTRTLNILDKQMSAATKGFNQMIEEQDSQAPLLTNYFD